MTRSARVEALYTLLECHVNLDLDGFEDVGQDGEPTGIKLPYVVTVEEGSQQVLSIRRNFAPNDPKKQEFNTLSILNFCLDSDSMALDSYT